VSVNKVMFWKCYFLPSSIYCLPSIAPSPHSRPHHRWFHHGCATQPHDSNSNEFFALRNQPHLRGHKYVIIKQRRTNSRRINFFSNRIVNLWNNLPSSTTDFTSFHKFDKSLNNDYLLLYCKLNFIQFVNCFSDAIFFIYCIHCLGL